MACCGFFSSLHQWIQIHSMLDLLLACACFAANAVHEPCVLSYLSQTVSEYIIKEKLSPQKTLLSL